MPPSSSLLMTAPTSVGSRERPLHESATGSNGAQAVVVASGCRASRREVKATRDNGELLVALYQAHASTNTLTAEQNATLQRILAASGKTPVPAR